MDFVKVTEDMIKLTDTAGLNYGEVILLCKIGCLSNNNDKACTASNAYFANLLCTTERTVERYISNMRKKELIKTHEDKVGMKTTTRYIYPQYKKISDLINEYNEVHNVPPDNYDGCSKIPPDNFCNTTRQNLHNHPTDFVKPPDKTVDLILEYNRIKENKRDNGAGAPKVANAPISANADKWTPKDDKSKEIFGSDIHTDARVIEILNNEFGKVEYGKVKTIEDICKEVWVTDCNVNTDKITEYIEEVLIK